MARLVTRNCKMTVATCMFINTQTEKTETIKCTVEGKLDGAKLEKYIRKQLESDEYKLVKIIEAEHKTQLRAITAECFMENSFEVHKK